MEYKNNRNLILTIRSFSNNHQFGQYDPTKQSETWMGTSLSPIHNFLPYIG